MKNVKELVKGINMMIEALSSIKESLEEDKDSKVIDLKSARSSQAPVDEPSEEQEDEQEDEVVENENSDRQKELEGLTYNEVKSLVSKLGGKAVGKKVDLIQTILELEAKDGEDTKEEVKEVKEVKKAREDKEEFGFGTILELKAELSEFELEELKDIAKELKLKYKNKATTKQLINIIVEVLDEEPERVDEVLRKMGYYEEDEEDVQEEEAEEVEETEETEDDEEDSIEDSLSELDIEDLADICEEYGLSAKGKKQALVDRIVEAIKNGVINEDDLFEDEDEEVDEEQEEPEVEAEDNDEPEDDGDDEEDGEDDEDDTEEDLDVEEVINDLDVEDLQEVAQELGLKAKKNKVALRKQIMTQDKEDIIDVLVDLDLVEEEAGDEEQEEESLNLTDKAIKSMAKVEDDIRSKYSKKKLKDTQIKKFLKDFDIEGLGKEEALEEYIKIQKSLVDDEGELHDLCDCYARGDKDFCCGRELEELENGSLYCSVCGEEYEVE